MTVAAAGVLANDLDATGDPLTAVNFTDSGHGDLTANAMARSLTSRMPTMPVPTPSPTRPAMVFPLAR